MPYDVQIRQLEVPGLLNLRADPQARSLAEGVLGFSLPDKVNATAAAGECLAFWSGPDAWLLRVSDKQEPLLRERLADALRSVHACITIVSDAHALYALEGPEARDVLSQATSFDTCPAKFVVGQCARVRFARSRALLHAAASDLYHVYAPRSYGRYLENWLARASGLA